MTLNKWVHNYRKACKAWRVTLFQLQADVTHLPPVHPSNWIQMEGAYHYCFIGRYHNRKTCCGNSSLSGRSLRLKWKIEAAVVCLLFLLCSQPEPEIEAACWGLAGTQECLERRLSHSNRITLYTALKFFYALHLTVAFRNDRSTGFFNYCTWLKVDLPSPCD